MVRSLNAMVLRTNRLEEVLLFYKVLGLPLKEESHDGGPTHYTCKFSGLHFGIYEHNPYKDRDRRAPGQETMVGFEVANLEQALQALEDLGVNIVIPSEQVSWGQRAVVLDPDGRPIELNQSE